MTIGLTGATGFIGGHVLRIAAKRGHDVIAFTRTPQRHVSGAVETRAFSLEAGPDLRGCDAVIHLAAEPIIGLWTKSKRRRVVESRVVSTQRIVEGIAALPEKPEVLVNGSAIGFYGDSADCELTEQAAGGTGFLAETVAAWENAARAAAVGRVVLLRTAVVLGRESGALRFMAPLFRCGLGGAVGNGRQWMSWIHVEDIARLALFAVEDQEVRGPINGSAPWPVRHRDFVSTLASVLHRPALLRAPAFVLRAAHAALAAELLESKRVVPAAALAAGFRFNFPQIGDALRDLFPQSR